MSTLYESKATKRSEIHSSVEDSYMRVEME